MTLLGGAKANIAKPVPIPLLPAPATIAKKIKHKGNTIKAITNAGRNTINRTRGSSKSTSSSSGKTTIFKSGDDEESSSGFSTTIIDPNASGTTIFRSDNSSPSGTTIIRSDETSSTTIIRTDLDASGTTIIRTDLPNTSPSPTASPTKQEPEPELLAAPPVSETEFQKALKHPTLRTTSRLELVENEPEVKVAEDDQKEEEEEGIKEKDNLEYVLTCFRI